MHTAPSATYTLIAAVTRSMLSSEGAWLTPLAARPQFLAVPTRHRNIANGMPFIGHQLFWFLLMSVRSSHYHPSCCISTKRVHSTIGGFFLYLMPPANFLEKSSHLCDRKTRMAFCTAELTQTSRAHAVHAHSNYQCVL